MCSLLLHAGLLLGSPVLSSVDKEEELVKKKRKLEFPTSTLFILTSPYTGDKGVL